MKGSALLETMTSRVMDECDSNRNAAQKEADALLAEANAKSQAQHESVMASLEREMEHLDERWKQMAHAEASRADLVVKNDAVNAVLETVKVDMRNLVASDAFGSVLEALLESLMKEASGEIVVVGPESRLDDVKLWLANHGHSAVTVEGSSDMWDGVAIQDPKRSYRISNTLTGRYHRIEEAARKHCMLTMFGEGA